MFARSCQVMSLLTLKKLGISICPDLAIRSVKIVCLLITIPIIESFNQWPINMQLVPYALLFDMSSIISTTQIVHFTFPTDCQIWEDKPVYLLNAYWHYLVCTTYHLRFHVTFLGHWSLLLLVFSHKWPVLVRHHMLLLAFWCNKNFQSLIMLEWVSDRSIHQLRSCFAITYPNELHSLLDIAAIQTRSAHLGQKISVSGANH